MNFFCISSLLNVVTISVDRFLAVHLHLRYQELVTHKRVIAAVISIWLLSAIISSSVFWDPLPISSQVLGLVIKTVCLIVVIIVYWRIYIILKRHKIQIEGLQIQEVQQGVQNGDLSNFLKLRKSALGTFFVCIVFLICYLPCYILSFLLLIHFLSPISFYEARLYVMTLFFLNSSLDPVIYCWKMGPIRRTLMDIMRGIVKLVQRITVRFWYQFTMHELRASAMVMLNLICKKYLRKIDGWRALTIKKIEHWSSIESGVRKYQLLVSSAFCMRNL